MIELIILIVICLAFLIAGVTLLVRTLKAEREEEELEEVEEVLHDDTITVVGDAPLSEERINQIRQDSETTEEMIKRSEFNSKIKPLKEYIVHIEEQHNAGQISDEDYKKELDCINETITKFEQDYNIKTEAK